MDAKCCCHRLINLGLPPPGLRFKASAMPFVQMENISHFLRACKSPPFNLQEHDVFLTVDLFESKDPAQVLQCLGAFSRAANKANPEAFPTVIGPRAAGLTPQKTGTGRSISPTPTYGRPRGMSNSSNASSSLGVQKPLVASKTGDSASGRWSPAKSPSQNGVSSWSSRANEGATSPAWNIAQYGYMGGASQANLGISFGGRRQITSAEPSAQSLFEEKRRKGKEAEEQRVREAEEARRKAKIEAEEDRRREQESTRLREQEKLRVDEERRRWEEEERQWRLTEEKRRRDEAEAEARLAEERAKARRKSGDSRLQGQFLSQYQAENGAGGDANYTDRIRELEKELEQARQREAQYESERQDRLRMKSGDAKARARSRSRPRPAAGTPSRQDSWARGDEREVLAKPAELLPRPQLLPRQGSRPLPDPAVAASPPAKVKAHRTGESAGSDTRSMGNTGGSRPLPDPKTYTSPLASPTSQMRSPLASPTSQMRSPLASPTSQMRSPLASPSSQMSRSDRFFASSPPPARHSPQPTYSRELGATQERDAEDRRRAQAQQGTKAGGWASKSLLEREMEMERQRQREWEESQKETASAARTGDGIDGIGGGIGGRWDVGQWAGFTGGDNQNRGGQGIGAGRRQIVGPRPLPSTPGSGR